MGSVSAGWSHAGWAQLHLSPNGGALDGFSAGWVHACILIATVSHSRPVGLIQQSLCATTAAAAEQTEAQKKAAAEQIAAIQPMIQKMQQIVDNSGTSAQQIAQLNTLITTLNSEGLTTDSFETKMTELVGMVGEIKKSISIWSLSSNKS